MGKVFVKATEIQEKNARFIDTRFNLQDQQWGQHSYNESHIEGAVYWHLERDLSDMSKSEGRHPMPSKKQLLNLVEEAGLTPNEPVYVYDQGGAPFAPRAWWMLKYAGFSKVFVVNGGFEALQAAGFKVTDAISSFKRSSVMLKWNESIYANRQDVKSIVDKKEQATLLDARSAVRYRGENEPIDVKAGHIPTAKNFDWEQLKEGTHLAANEKLLQKVGKDEEVVVYCGSGVTASPLYAVLADEGYENIRLYIGSFSDWITEFDIETGENE